MRANVLRSPEDFVVRSTAVKLLEIYRLSDTEASDASSDWRTA